MLCERCGTRHADIHLVKVVNGERRVQHLCRECAGEFLSTNDVTNLMKLSLSVEGLMGIDEAFRELVMPALRGAYAQKKSAKHICPHCGGVLPDSMFERRDAEDKETARPDAAEDKVMTAEEEMAALEKKNARSGKGGGLRIRREAPRQDKRAEKFPRYERRTEYIDVAGFHGTRKARIPDSA